MAVCGGRQFVVWLGRAQGRGLAWTIGACGTGGWRGGGGVRLPAAFAVGDYVDGACFEGGFYWLAY